MLGLRRIPHLSVYNPDLVSGSARCSFAIFAGGKHRIIRLT
jgi:hypothetical protein